MLMRRKMLSSGDVTVGGLGGGEEPDGSCDSASAATWPLSAGALGGMMAVWIDSPVSARSRNINTTIGAIADEE